MVDGFDGTEINSHQGSFISGSMGNNASFYSASSSGPKSMRKKNLEVGLVNRGEKLKLRKRWRRLRRNS